MISWLLRSWQAHNSLPASINARYLTIAEKFNVSMMVAFDNEALITEDHKKLHNFLKAHS